jgi:glycosyltransferase involved in cell wall biosynthesis
MLEKCEISAIIPAYNECRRIEKAINITRESLYALTPFAEVIISEDGSSDGTYDIAAKLAEDNAETCLLHSDKRCGKGLALKRAIKAAKGDIICFMDADMATDMLYLPVLIDAIRVEEYDIAIASRLAPASNIERSKTRSIASKAYNTMVRLILRSRIYDHQCGFKAFKRSSILPILDQIKDDRWFWDTEMLVRAQFAGYKIKEIPVSWKEADSTQFNLIKDSYDMGMKIIKLWWDLANDRGTRCTCEESSLDCFVQEKKVN